MYDQEFIDDFLDYISSPLPPPQSMAQYVARGILDVLIDAANNSEEDSATIAYYVTKGFLKPIDQYSDEIVLETQLTFQKAVEEMRAQVMSATILERSEEYGDEGEEDSDEWDKEVDETDEKYKEQAMSIIMDIECPKCGLINEVEYDPVNLEYINPICEECGNPLFDEEEDYIDKPPVFVSSPSAITSAQRKQEPDRYQPAQGQSRLGRHLVKDTQTGEYRETRDYVDVPQASRRQGLYIIGATGTGKSGLIENLIVQDIKQGVGVCVLDPHGDLIKDVLARMDRREDDVIFLDITDYHYPFGINLFACSDPTNPLKVQEIVEQVTHIFEKLLGVSTSTPLILEYLMKCTQTLIANPGYTMAEIPLLLQDTHCRKRLVANVSDIDVTMFWKRFEGKRPSVR